MRDTVYLILRKEGVVSMRKTRPSLKSGQYAVRLTVEVPRGYFERTVPEAHLEIPEDHMIEAPVEVDVAPPPAPEEPEEEEGE